MGKRKTTSSEELQDAIDRISKKPEARQNSRNSKVWKGYLVEVLGITPKAISSDAGQNFWNDVRRGIQGKKPGQRPTEKQLNEANVEIGYKKTTGQVFYHSKETGRFISIKDMVING